MKKRLFTVIAAVLVLVAALTVFTACDGDKLFESSWEIAAISNAQGEIIACGESFSYDESVPRVTVTCNVSLDGEISISYAAENKKLTGKMTQTSTGADGSEKYSIEFSDGRLGTAVYLSSKDDVYPSDQDKDDQSDIAEKYEFTVTVGEEYTLYFVRGSKIK